MGKTLKQVMETVPNLQRDFSPSETGAMQTRGDHIRRVIPELLKNIAGQFGSCVEGSSGFGKNSRVPWVRVFDPNLAAGATEGRYAVFLFAADGSAVFLSLIQGALERRGKNYFPRVLKGVSTSSDSARPVLKRHDHDLKGLETRIILEDIGRFGKSYEAGNIFAFRYRADSIPDDARVYEIKTDPSPRICLREAIGQLLEYALFWSGRPDVARLIVVGETAIDKDGQDYLDLLNERFKLSIEYEAISV